MRGWRGHCGRTALASIALAPVPTVNNRFTDAKPKGLARERYWAPFGLWFLLLATLPAACGKRLEVAECNPEPKDDGSEDGGPTTATGFVFPWSTGFEVGFCEYVHPGGFCYRRGNATSELVTSPVHSGNFAAAYTTYNDLGTQARCVRQGTFPKSAYYSAWFYLPPTKIESGNWNLIHISGNDTPTSAARGLWDVSVVETSNGQLRLSVFNFIGGNTPTLSPALTIPTEAWFHVVFYLNRASDATGEVKLYQDDQLLLHLTGLVTDDSNWGQWYVGNYATGLAPSQTTIYVDDVSLSPNP